MNIHNILASANINMGVLLNRYYSNSWYGSNGYNTNGGRVGTPLESIRNSLVTYMLSISNILYLIAFIGAAGAIMVAALMLGLSTPAKREQYKGRVITICGAVIFLSALVGIVGLVISIGNNVRSGIV